MLFFLFDEFGIDNCKIELIENYPAESKAMLQKQEGHYIKNTYCVNKKVEGRTRKEYQEDNITNTKLKSMRNDENNTMKANTK